MNGETVTCEVRNSIGTSKSTQTLNVYYKPQFKSEVAVIAAELGENSERLLFKYVRIVKLESRHRDIRDKLRRFSHVSRY